MAYNKIVSVEIDDIAYTGYGVGRVEGKVIFVPFTSVGDKVLAKVVKVTKGYMEGELINVLSSGKERIKVSCPHYKVCGGCQLMHIDYSGQLEAKENILKNALRKCENLKFGEVLQSPERNHYRQKVRFSVRKTAKGSIFGFLKLKSHKIVKVRECLIAKKEINNILPALKAFLDNSDVPFNYDKLSLIWDDRDKKIILVFYVSRYNGGLNKFYTNLLSEIDSVKAVSLKSRRDSDDIDSAGDSSFFYDLPAGDGTVTLKGDGRAFSQVNRSVNLLLAEKVIQLLEPEKGMKVVDLYCGNGNFSIPASVLGAEVKGYDSSPVSVKCAYDVAAEYGLNAEYSCLDCADGLRELINENYRPHAVILDPPRAGAKDIIADLLNLNAEKIIYISCDPATLGRDIEVLEKSGYCAVNSFVADMFPQTYHLESLTLLTR